MILFLIGSIHVHACKLVSVPENLIRSSNKAAAILVFKAMLLLFILLLFSSVRSQDFCQPEQIRLSIRGDDGEFFIVTWTTFSEAESWVEFGLNPDDVKGQRVQGSKELFRDGGSLHRLEYIHRAVFPSLQPQKKYCK